MSSIKGLPPWFTRAGSSGAGSGAGSNSGAGSTKIGGSSGAGSGGAGSGGGAGGGQGGGGRRLKRRRFGGEAFVDRNLAAVSGYAMGLISGSRHAERAGLLQSVDARTRFLGILALVAASAVASSAPAVASMLALALALAAASKVGPWTMARKAAPAVLFTGVIMLPVLTGFVTPGTPVWGFTVRGVEVTVTSEGVRTGLFFLLRVSTMVSFVMLLFLTTRQTDFFRALSALPVPAFFTTALFMTFRYVFTLLKITEDSVLARRSRAITGSAAAERRHWAASRLAYLLRRSLATAEEVSQAMASRGFTGRVRTFPPPLPGPWDMAWIGFASFVFFIVLFMG